ncbi:hypothetical protein [Microbacterium elymi]|uniref:Uncharacterized protein n=1 Tax=Microbacterium elymi TaxID=2909587 RepID=A0ABY5NJ22_9MICO|nr:hypothetical protein [Microbacterium elymi]UUT35170.1 hypothetical protein L2X98_33535 [Microbacterium elymi]
MNRGSGRFVSSLRSSLSELSSPGRFVSSLRSSLSELAGAALLAQRAGGCCAPRSASWGAGSCGQSAL